MSQSPAQRLDRLVPPSGPVRIVIDTDTYNEIDDQFALAYALLSPEQLTVEAVYAAPFHNDRSSGPEDGMLRSYDEIGRVLERVGQAGQVPVLHGARTWLDAGEPGENPAADDLIRRAMQGDTPLYVVAIGAITNVATALLRAPEIMERIVVVWLGGHPTYWHHTDEFNLKQDLRASRLLLDSGVPLVLVPCLNVAEQIKTTAAELERFMRGKSPIGDYLYGIFADYYTDHYARSKEIWDLGPLAWLLHPASVDSILQHSPILADGLRWSADPHRHLVREIRKIDRDVVFRDLFTKLAASADTGASGDS